MLGYGIAAGARPLLALAAAPWQVLALRCTDRVGKGIRGSPRDKLLTQSAPEGALAEVFSFHRGMDHLGAAIGLFTLGNSTDALLLLRAQALGVPAAQLPLLWTLLHLVRASLSWPLGRAADRLGRRGALAAGWLWYAVCYAGFAAASAPWQVWLLFAVYGLVAGLTEGSERALVAAAVPPARRGAALGVYNLVSGLGLLVASLLAGALWERVSAPFALGLGALLAGLAAAALIVARPAGISPPVPGAAS